MADKGLTQPVEEGDYTGLVEVMGHLMAVKDRQATTDEMFEPLKQTIELLKTYGQELPEDVHTKLEVRTLFFGDPMVASAEGKFSGQQQNFMQSILVHEKELSL